jgi:hypothetical protein
MNYNYTLKFEKPPEKDKGTASDPNFRAPQGKVFTVNPPAKNPDEAQALADEHKVLAEQVEKLYDEQEALLAEQEKIRKSLTQTAEGLKQGKIKIDRLTGIADQLDKSIVNASTQLNQLEQQLGTSTQVTKTAQQKLQDLKSKLDRVNQETEILNAQMAETENNPETEAEENPALAEQQERLEALQQELGQTNVDLETAQAIFDQAQTEQNSLSDKVGISKQKLDMLQNDLDRTQRELKNVQQEQDQLQTTYDDLSEQHTAVVEKLDSNLDVLEPKEARLDNIKARQEELRQKPQAIQPEEFVAKSVGMIKQQENFLFKKHYQWEAIRKDAKKGLLGLAWIGSIVGGTLGAGALILPLCVTAAVGWTAISLYNMKKKSTYKHDMDHFDNTIAILKQVGSTLDKKNEAEEKDKANYRPDYNLAINEVKFVSEIAEHRTGKLHSWHKKIPVWKNEPKDIGMLEVLTPAKRKEPDVPKEREKGQWYVDLQSIPAFPNFTKSNLKEATKSSLLMPRIRTNDVEKNQAVLADFKKQTIEAFAGQTYPNDKDPKDKIDQSYTDFDPRVRNFKYWM